MQLTEWPIKVPSLLFLKSSIFDSITVCLVKFQGFLKMATPKTVQAFVLINLVFATVTTIVDHNVPFEEIELLLKLERQFWRENTSAGQ